MLGTRSGSLGGRPCLKPHSVVLLPGNEGGSLAPAAARPPPSPAPPGRPPAPPQHQGSREALPRHRLSLRCQALWMRLRASSNFFLLEASWMALRGRSTWVGRAGNLRAAPRAPREPRGRGVPPHRV